jgi:hypothetical protein
MGTAICGVEWDAMDVEWYWQAVEWSDVKFVGLTEKIGT